MSITAEFCRKQFFTGEIEPGALCRTVCKPEHLALFGRDEIQKMIECLNLELSAREEINV